MAFGFPFFSAFFAFFFVIFYSFPSIYAQNTPSNAPVPPLQWINLSNLLQGTSKPPPLRDAAMGYDETSRSIVIFGGVSQSGLPQSQTFLLNLDSLVWSTPTPPANLQRTPPPRSAAVTGIDIAASNRHGFIIIGGKDSNGGALSDVWEYDFINQFWSAVELSAGGPGPRYSASGGNDIRTPAVQDPIVPGPNNTFYLAGGFDGTSLHPLSDIWRLNISGTLASNLPDNVKGSWERLNVGNAASIFEQAGTVLGNSVIAAGGCHSPTLLSDINITCAAQDAFILDTQRRSAINPIVCPAPRIGGVLVPNLNSNSSSFSSQVFLLLGTFNTSLWDDSDGLANGEVAILDTNTATWTRVLPSGDPGSSGNAQFPSPREGASAVTFIQGLVGSNRPASSDTIIFGGQDTNGNLLSDVWLLRAYDGVISPQSLTWAGFGNGQLKTGVNADGTGVRSSYIPTCASLTTSSPKPPSTSHSPTPTPPSNQTPDVESAFSVSFVHKLLSPLSVVLALPVLLFFRWTEDQPLQSWKYQLYRVVFFTALGIAAFGLGVVGLILSFTSITSTIRPKDDIHLKTGHGIAGLAFFICLYVIVPAIYLLSACYRRPSSTATSINSGRAGSRTSEAVDPNSLLGGGDEKDSSVMPGPGPTSRSLTPSIRNASPPATPRPRTLSWDASHVLHPSSIHDGPAMSSESAPSSPRKFEVLNRPGHSRARNLSGSWPPAQPPLAGRNLSDIDWLLRRRSLNAVGELDYVITQAHNAQVLASQEASIPPTTLRPTIQTPRLDRLVAHVLIHISILGLAGVSLAMLWERSPRYLFALLLTAIVVYGAIMVWFAWYYRPSQSILTTLVSQVRGYPPTPGIHPSPSSSMPMVNSTNPYTHHRPPFHSMQGDSDMYHNQHAAPMSVDTDDNDDEMDDDARQRAIEEEMERRDVSIITVPRRKLTIANPS
ncbi:hypothetical protein CVT24_003213 [Panaeolus cyanescens]|uniref:Uncharacterized protein n=1 Tax=Panaeolus cyanescens TaxID=181874 RepID=A0A409VUE7_9AGAR|nr:hypothetical protein CVT24_003213 [Panaeolus cyanescens]